MNKRGKKRRTASPWQPQPTAEVFYFHVLSCCCFPGVCCDDPGCDITASLLCLCVQTICQAAYEQHSLSDIRSQAAGALVFKGGGFLVRGWFIRAACRLRGDEKTPFLSVLFKPPMQMFHMVPAPADRNIWAMWGKITACVVDLKLNQRLWMIILSFLIWYNSLRNKVECVTWDETEKQELKTHNKTLYGM